MKAPPRLLDDPSTPSELRRDLERSAKSTAGYDAAAGLAAFSATIAGGAGVAAGTSAAAQAGSAGTGAAVKASGVLGSLSLKATLAAVGTAAVVAVGVANLPARPASPNKPAPAGLTHAGTPAARAPQTEPASSRERVELPSEQAPAAPTQAIESLKSASPAVHAEGSLHATLPSDLSARREIAQLGRIKALLESDPRAALRLAESGEREFGRGLLREERQGLAVLALWKLGRGGEARARAEAFLRSYPQSGLRAQLAASLQKAE